MQKYYGRMYRYIGRYWYRYQHVWGVSYVLSTILLFLYNKLNATVMDSRRAIELPERIPLSFTQRTTRHTYYEGTVCPACKNGKLVLEIHDWLGATDTYYCCPVCSYAKMKGD